MSYTVCVSNRTRSIVSSVAFALAFLVSLVAAPVLYVSTVIEEEDAFVSLTDAIIEHPDVRSEIATQATNLTLNVLEVDEVVAELLPEQTRSIAVPLTRIAANQITEAAFVVTDTSVGIETRHAATRELHRQFLADNESLVIDLRAVLVRTARELGGPTVGVGAAKLVADTDVGRIVLVEEDSPEQGLLAAVRAIPVLGLALLLIGFGLWTLGVVIAPDRRAAILRAALLNAAASVLAIVIVAIGLYGSLGAIGDGSPSAIAVAEVVTQDFIRLQWGGILGSLGVALVAMMLGDREAAVALRRLPAELWQRSPNRWLTISEVVGDNPAMARIVVWVLGGLTLIGWRNPTVRVICTVTALTVIAHGFIWLLTTASPLAARARARLGVPDTSVVTGSSAVRRLRLNAFSLVIVLAVFWPAWSRDVIIGLFTALAALFVLIDLRTALGVARTASQPVETVSVDGWSRRRTLAVAVGAAVVIVATGTLFTNSADERVAASTGCNGAVELCDRRIDEVVFAGSHNAMSSTDLGWELAMQTGDIVTQLDHGVRALLIDALYWSDEGSVEGGNEAAAAVVIEASLSDDEPRPGTWLCHGFCALGATDLTAGLADISLWLDANPREVLIIIVQDEIATADLVAAIEASGLRDHVHKHVPGTTWPTLGELIDSDERVLVYGENGGSPDSWFQNVWDSAFSETPFAFGLRSDFTCVPNRGDDNNDLFLVNHWLTTGIPVREVAESVNSRDALLKRVEECEKERGRRPTVLAVDFVETGDLVSTVAELNGVEG